jgi:hypothetical protein
MEYLNQNADPRPHIEQYKPQKAKTAKIIMLITGAVFAVIIFFIALFFGIISIFKNHPAYHLATDSIRTNTEITALIGEVESFGFLPNGNINISPGRGDANFTIRARGAHGEVRVFIALQMRNGGDWEIVRFDFVQIR